MNRITRKTVSPASILLAGLIGCIAFSTARAADNCTGAQLSGSNMLPFMTTLQPADLAINLTGPGCATPTGFEVDTIVCFVPTSSCSVNFTCSYTHSGTIGTGNGAANVRDVGQGQCTAAAGPCVAGVTTTASPATVSSVSLTAGTNYCFVCNSDGQGPNDVQTISISASGGSCGSLPTELQRFDVH